MKIVVSVTLAAIFGMVAASSSAEGPTKLPKGASGGMWTMTPAPAVSACIAHVLNTSPSGDTVMAADGTRYEITSPRQKNTAYITQVSRFGPLPTNDIGTAIALCA